MGDSFSDVSCAELDGRIYRNYQSVDSGGGSAESAEVVEVPGGIKVHGYRYEAANEWPVERKATRIEYPDGRVVENPSDELIAELVPTVMDYPPA
jgi:hypothetical protein